MHDEMSFGGFNYFAVCDEKHIYEALVPATSCTGAQGYNLVPGVLVFITVIIINNNKLCSGTNVHTKIGGRCTAFW